MMPPSDGADTFSLQTSHDNEVSPGVASRAPEVTPSLATAAETGDCPCKCNAEP